MTSSIIYNKITVEIPQGGTTFSKPVHLEKGTCLGVHLVPISVGEPTFPVEVGIDNSQGGALLHPVDFRDYIHRQGGYFQGMKQVNFQTNNTNYNVNITASQPLTEAFVAQLVFTIQRDIVGSN